MFGDKVRVTVVGGHPITEAIKLYLPTGRSGMTYSPTKLVETLPVVGR
jgi:hypothetical protein